MELIKSVFIAIITVANLIKGPFFVNGVEFDQMIKCEGIMLHFGVSPVYSRCVLGGFIMLLLYTN